MLNFSTELSWEGVTLWWIFLLSEICFINKFISAIYYEDPFLILILIKIISYSLLSLKGTTIVFFPMLMSLTLPLFLKSTSRSSRFAANPEGFPYYIRIKRVKYGLGSFRAFDGFLIHKCCPDSIPFPEPSNLPALPSQFCFNCREEQ